MNILISLQYRCAKLCDLGMARIDMGDKGVIFWTDYVATRWYGCWSAVQGSRLVSPKRLGVGHALLTHIRTYTQSHLHTRTRSAWQ